MTSKVFYSAVFAFVLLAVFEKANHAYNYYFEYTTKLTTDDGYVCYTHYTPSPVMSCVNPE